MTRRNSGWFYPAIIPVLILILPMVSYASDHSKRLARVEAAAQVGDYPSRPWDQAFVYENKSYLVRTNTSKEVASYIGQLMNFAQDRYRSMFNYTDEVPRVLINAYRTEGEYNVVAQAVGLPFSGGFFMQRDGVSTIHLPYTKSYGNPSQPTTTLLHEGTHQFVAMALDFKIPKDYLNHFQDGITTLNSVPRWLNEGLATYMEVSRYNGEKLVVGEINKERLKDLQYRIRHETYIPLHELFTTDNPADFTAAHYSSAWGVIYWFRHDADRKRQNQKRKILVDYILACRNGFMEKPRSEFKHFIKKDFHALWRKHVTEKSQEVFVNLTVGKGRSFERWEKAWKKWILTLDPKDPNGGLRK